MNVSILHTIVHSNKSSLENARDWVAFPVASVLGGRLIKVYEPEESQLPVPVSGGKVEYLTQKIETWYDAPMPIAARVCVFALCVFFYPLGIVSTASLLSKAIMPTSEPQGGEAERIKDILKKL